MPKLIKLARPCRQKSSLLMIGTSFDLERTKTDFSIYKHQLLSYFDSDGEMEIQDVQTLFLSL